MLILVKVCACVRLAAVKNHCMCVCIYSRDCAVSVVGTLIHIAQASTLHLLPSDSQFFTLPVYSLYTSLLNYVHV